MTSRAYLRNNGTEDFWFSKPESSYRFTTANPEPVIWVHGAGAYLTSKDSPAGFLQGFLDTVEVMIIMRLLGYDYTCLMADFGDPGFGWASPYVAWGNDAHVARIESHRQWLETNEGATGKVTLIGTSMGGCGVMNYAKTYPNKVRAVIATIPALDLWDMYNNRGFTMIRDTGYYTSNATLDAHNPVMFASSLDANIPMILMTAASDTTCVPATADAFQAARPQTMRYELPAPYAHNFASISQMTLPILKFVRDLTL